MQSNEIEFIIKQVYKIITFFIVCCIAFLSDDVDQSSIFPSYNSNEMSYELRSISKLRIHHV